MHLTLSEPQAIPVDQVVFDASIYPREKHNTGTVAAYKEAIHGGSTFPPIVVDAVGLRILDGKHRWLAHQEAGSATILAQMATPTDPPVLDTEEKTQALLSMYLRTAAAELNCDHGDRLNNAERKAVAQALAQAEVDADIKPNVPRLAKQLKLSERTLRDWLKGILQAQEVAENARIRWMDMLGWTQEEVAEPTGVTQRTVSDRLSRFGNNADSADSSKDANADPDAVDPVAIVKQWLARGLGVDAIAAKEENIPANLIQAVSLQDKADAERMAELQINVQPYDAWHFSSCHPRMGHDWPGRIPGELVCHLLYFFTEPGDLVIDPMVGSGTTIDACAYMGRRVYGFDAHPDNERFDIVKHDIATDGWHPRTKQADLIFWDPPYFSKKDAEYGEHSVSRFDRSEYLQFFAEAFAKAHETVKPGTRLAFLMSDWDDPDSAENGIFLWDYADLLRKAGWMLARQIQVPLSTQQVHPDIVTKFRASRRLARLERYVIVGIA